MIEQLLMVLGVEPNPGPEVEHAYGCWSHDVSCFLWPTIGAMEMTPAGHVKRLWKYFDPWSKGGGWFTPVLVYF